MYDRQIRSQPSTEKLNNDNMLHNMNLSRSSWKRRSFDICVVISGIPKLRIPDDGTWDFYENSHCVKFKLTGFRLKLKNGNSAATWK